MSLGLEFLPEAVAEVEEATRYYEERVPGLGVRFRVEVESVCASLVRQPRVWRERAGGFRRVNLPGFPFYVAFFTREERILVAAIGHARRHPDYWKRREL
jgi:plasmid stabilization system protein ParE